LGLTPSSIDELLELWAELVFALQFDGKIKLKAKQRG
jgi:hypothetical protein